MHTVTIFSNRMYENEINVNISNLNDTIEKFNSILYSVYNLIILSLKDADKYNQKLNGNSLYLYVKNKYKLDDYYANSIIRLAKGKIDSQIKLNKEYKKQKELSLKEIKDKLKYSESKLKDFLKLRDDFIKYRNDGCNGKLKIKGIKNISINGSCIEVRYMKKGKIYADTYNPYSFEYEYLNKKIKHLRSLISKYKYRINILNNKIKRLCDIKYGIFGSKKLMQEYSRCSSKDKKKLKDMIMYRKYKSFSISGRKDAKTGNFIFKPVYHKATDTFDMSVRMIDKCEMVFKNISFPYRGEELVRALNSKMPICFGMVKKIKDGRVFYLISASFDLEMVKRINTDISIGVIGIDFNYKHIDVSDIDENGNMVNSFTVYYDTEDSALKNELSLRKALTEIAEYAYKKHKIIVIEELDLKTAKFKANRDKPKNKGMNRILHNFPYKKYNDIIHQLGMKYEFLVKEVKPAFTSVIGKLKYADNMKLSTHIAASFVIGRRGMGFSERLLNGYKKIVINNDYSHKSEWAKWNFINKTFNVR